MDLYDHIDVLEQRYRDGDKHALFDAIWICLCRPEPVPAPAWVQAAVSNAWMGLVGARIKSWDEVFGPPWPKGTNVSRLRWKYERAPFVWKRARELIASGHATDDTLFEEVGRLCATGPRQAKELYYMMERGWPPELKATLLRDETI
jgi:hypothetical protein